MYNVDDISYSSSPSKTIQIYKQLVKLIIFPLFSQTKRQPSYDIRLMPAHAFYYISDALTSIEYIPGVQ